MTKYFFPIYAKDTFIPDWEGTELPDLAAAHLRALKIIHESMTYVSSEPIWRGWMVRIIDERSRNVLTVLYPNRLWTNHQQSWDILLASIRKKSGTPMDSRNVRPIQG